MEVVSSISWLLYQWGMNPWYPKNSRFVGLVLVLLL
jgi:hypothetical protein